MISRHNLWRPLAAVAVGAASLTLAGCNIVGFVGAMEETRRRNSTKDVAEQYQGLKGKKWAVVVTADRIIQADNPAVVGYLTSKITERLADPKQQNLVGATGYVPAKDVLRYTYENPRWVGMPRAELARNLGVERLIVVDLEDYRLNDPGNQYLWAGVAAGSVGVIEADSTVPDEFAFEKPVKVTFPDKDGYGPEDLPRAAVATELAGRFVDRASWLFYNHKEPYYPKY